MNENPKMYYFALCDAFWYKANIFWIEVCGAYSADAGIRENVNPLFLKETLKLSFNVFQ